MRLVVVLVAVSGLLTGSLASCGGSDEQSGSGGSGGSGGGVDASLGGSAGSAASGGSGGGSGGGPADVVGELLGLLDAPPCEPPTVGSACGTLPQCGCDLGEKCDVSNLTTGDALCVADGTVKANQACSSLVGKCEKGTTCVGGACKAFCKTAADCPGKNRTCRQVQASGKAVPGMFTCTAGCDPVAPGLVCGSTLTCAFVVSGGPDTDCLGAGTGVGPGACAGNAGCAPGYTCVTNGPSKDCLKWCRLSNPNDCASTEFCQSLSTMPVIDGVQYGVCFKK